MDDVSSLWIVGIVALVVGGLVGMLIGRSSPATRRGEALQAELNETRRELETYKSEVGEHFARTADLVNNLTESYRDVHQHLAKGASALCADASPLKSLQASDAPSLTDQREAAASAPPSTARKGAPDYEPPRDYAPKHSPDDAGTLSETYGLKNEEKGEAPQEPTKTADQVPG